MLNKYSFYLLICFIFLSIETDIKELKQYNQITVYERTYIYLSLDNFAKESEVYIELEIFDDGYYYTQIPLKYRQSDTHNISNFIDFKFYEIISNNYYRNKNSYTFYFTIYLNKKTDYLLLIPPDFFLRLTVKNTRNSETSESKRN